METWKERRTTTFNQQALAKFAHDMVVAMNERDFDTMVIKQQA